MNPASRRGRLKESGRGIPTSRSGREHSQPAHNNPQHHKEASKPPQAPPHCQGIHRVLISGTQAKTPRYQACQHPHHRGSPPPPSVHQVPPSASPPQQPHSITWQGVIWAFCDRRGADSTEIQRVVQHGIYSAENICIAAGGKCRGIRAIPAVFYAPQRIFFLVKKNQYVCQIGKYSAFNTLWKAWTASKIHISLGLSNTQTQFMALKKQLSKRVSNLSARHTGADCPSHTGSRDGLQADSHSKPAAL